MNPMNRNPLMQQQTKNMQKQMKDMITQARNSGNPEQFAKQLMANNPQFAQYVNSMQGVNPMQFMQSMGFDPNKL